jgi:septal ring factor EnvC (AmiA/AmiB activator)
MVVEKRYILFFILACVFVFPQNIDRKKKELNEIKSEINKLESELQKKSKSEKKTLELVENFNKQSFLLNKLISKYKKEEIEKEDEIGEREEEITMLEREMKFLKSNYSRYVLSTYKYGMENDLAYLLTSQTLDQAITRFKYLKRFSDRRQDDLAKIKDAKKELIEVKEILKEERIEKQQLAEEKQKEEGALLKKLGEKKKYLSTIKNDKALLSREINLKRKAESNIKNLIASLVEKEERRKKEEAKRREELSRKNESAKIKEYAVKKKESRSTLTVKRNEKESPSFSYSYDNLAAFSSLKGRLNWPISGAKIVRNFGENKNAKLNTVTLNYGVDLLARSDLSVKCVAEGIVSAIDYVAGYGSVIIITHKGDYRTVYSHLSEIFVHEGERLKMGAAIAKVGESLEGNILHFEIWNNRNHQNPEIWLAKR